MVDKAKSLDDLLGSEEPNGTFHDATLLSVSIDYSSRVFVAEFELCVGDPDASDEQVRERRRAGRLRVEGLQVWAVEPPTGMIDAPLRRLWLTADGPLAECPTEAGKALALSVGENGAAWYLYFSDLNAFAYLVGERQAFEWR
jgi:hypothetical protein